MPVFHPRVAAKVIVPAIGLPQDRQAQQQTDQTFTLNVRPTHVRFVANNYNEADECEITGTYDEMGLDPRYLRSAEVYVYIADADVSGNWTPAFDDLRFVGIARDVSRVFNEHGGKIVTIKALDYTCLFLEAKSYPPSKIPPFTDTLQQAWERICDNTGYWDLDTHQINSTVSVLKDKLVFEGGINAPGPSLGSAVPARLAKLGKVQVHGDADAWAIWRTCCESLGLITFIRGDRCVVTTATDYYTAGNSPRMIYGLNVMELTESRDLGQLSSKWVCVRSYDPLGNKSLESLYPPPGIATRKKKLKASANGPSASVKAQDYECFDLPFAVADQATLDNIANRIWQERTRQELHGSLRTRYMSVADTTGASFDLLKLAAGDQIQVEIAREALDGIQALPTISARLNALVAKGYSSDMAGFIANNLDSIAKLPPQFLVHSVETELQVTGPDGGASYNTRIEFLNRVDISDSGAVTAQASGDPLPPMLDQTMVGPRGSTPIQ